MVQHVLPSVFLINLLILVSLTIVSIIFSLYWLPSFFWLMSFLLSVVVILVKLHVRGVPLLIRVDWTWLLVLWCIHDHISCAYREVSAQKIPRTTQKILSHGFLSRTNQQGVILQPSTMIRWYQMRVFLLISQWATSAGGKMTPHRGNDFGCHTRGGHGDRDTRIEIPPGCQGDDLKTMLASCWMLGIWPCCILFLSFYMNNRWSHLGI